MYRNVARVYHGSMVSNWVFEIASCFAPHEDPLYSFYSSRYGYPIVLKSLQAHQWDFDSCGYNRSRSMGYDDVSAQRGYKNQAQQGKLITYCKTPIMWAGTFIFHKRSTLNNLKYLK